MTVNDSNDYVYCTTGDDCFYGWATFTCGCKLRQWDKPNTATAVGEKCPIYKSKMEREE